MEHTSRRYDIDWLRVIAIGLLLVYHIAIGFQPWSNMIAFITNKNSWPALWIPMSMLNIWRIPLLFFVSGMGVYFALRQRSWAQLLGERAQRILIPFIFGMFCIVPLHIMLWQSYNNITLTYTWDPGHLWFLKNIFIYVVLLLPLFYYLKKNDQGKLAVWIRKIIGNPLGLLLVTGIMTVEAFVIKPWPYELYATTWHGFVLGLLAFLFGFCFVFTGLPFWEMLRKGCWYFLIAAFGLYLIRMVYFSAYTPYYLLVPESMCWIFSVLALGYKYLNKPSKSLQYLSQAAYPVYIIHMVVLYLASTLLFPSNIPVWLQFTLQVFLTLGGCLLVYEFLIRRIKWVRPLFGLKH